MSATELIETELERLARAQLLAATEAKRHLRQLIESATEVIESLEVEADGYTVSTSVLIMDRDLDEALREVTKYDAWRGARRHLASVKRKLERGEDT